MGTLDIWGFTQVKKLVESGQFEPATSNLLAPLLEAVLKGVIYSFYPQI
jgi:hypothetical protein